MKTSDQVHSDFDNLVASLIIFGVTLLILLVFAITAWRMNDERQKQQEHLNKIRQIEHYLKR